MDDSRSPSSTIVAERDMEPQRPCTRCHGAQHLVASGGGMGKYRCDTCELVVGFDLDADEPEFLIDRGLPREYTKQVFGDRLQPVERRMTQDVSA